MAPQEIYLRWAAGRSLLQDPYRHQRCSASRIYGLSFYATAPQHKPHLVPKQRPGVPNQIAAVPKQKLAPPKLNPFIPSVARKQNNYVPPNSPKAHENLSPNTTRHVPVSPEYKPLVQRRSREAPLGSVTAPKLKPESKSKGSVFIPRIRIAVGVIFVGSLLYSMVPL